MNAGKTGKLIAERRKAKGLTQKALAEQLGVTNKAVSKWETGQGMPDISMVTELSRILEISVDELLNGEYRSFEEKIPEKKKRCKPTLRGVIGGILIGAAVCLIAIQCLYIVFKKYFEMEYIWSELFYIINGMILIFIFAGGIYLKKTRRLFMKKAIVIAFLSIFFANGAAAVIFNDGVKSIVSLSPGLDELLVLKREESGRTTVFRQQKLLFVKAADTLPFTMSKEPKLQWLADDAGAVTYKSADDDGLHQYVMTYGDRGDGISYYYVWNAAFGRWTSEGQFSDYTVYKSADDDGLHQYVMTYGDRGDGISYYYVWNAAFGRWTSEGQFSDYTVEFKDGESAGIYVHTPSGDEVYTYDDCLQYGTLALVFPRKNPKWTVVLLMMTVCNMAHWLLYSRGKILNGQLS